MACIVFDGNRYLIGDNFAAAVAQPTLANPVRSSGLFSHNESAQRYLWQSTLSQQESERVLRASLAKESKRLTFFRSQAA